MRGWPLLILSACYAPQPPAGSPCTRDEDCPAPLVCAPATQSCERTAGPAVDAPVVLVDGCTPEPEICGDGIDQSCDAVDPPCAANDAPGGAIDVTAGGTFTGDLAVARDDVGDGNCGAPGGRDLFYKVALGGPTVFYFDTFDSSFDTIVRVYRKPCAEVGGGANAAVCGDDACGGAQSLVAVSLPAGESCIVVDQASSAEATGDVVLHVIRGERDGVPLPAGLATVSGNTCSSANTTDPIDVNCDAPGSGGRDDAYFFTTCPGQSLALDAKTCNLATWDTVLYVRRNGDKQLGCNDDTCNGQSQITSVSIANGSLFYLIVDGFDPTECGDYGVATNLR